MKPLVRFFGRLSGSRYTVNSVVGADLRRSPRNHIEKSYIGDRFSLGSHSTILESVFGEDCAVADRVGFRRSKAGDRVQIDAACEINGSSFASDVYLGSTCLLYDVGVGSHSYLESTVRANQTVIGNYCSIAPGVTFGLGRHPLDGPGTSPLFYKQKTHFAGHLRNKNLSYEEFPPITVGSDVWLGQEALIMGGVTIGNGAIVGARAVVTKDVPDFAVVVGVPARVVKYRFPESVRARLQELSWWDWPLEKLRLNLERLDAIVEGLAE